MAKLPEPTIQEIIRLHRDGFSNREIGRTLKIDKSSVAKYIKGYIPHAENAGPPPGDKAEGVMYDTMDTDGSIEIRTRERPMSAEEMMELCGVDKKLWVPHWSTINCWQGFYKLKNYLPPAIIKKIVKMAQDGATAQAIKEEIEAPQHGHRKVDLFQSKATFKRIVAEEIHDAILQFARDTIIPLPTPKTKSRKSVLKEPQVVSWGLWDAHLGMHAWRKEVGEDFDLSIAKRRIANSVDDMVEELRLYPIDRIWMPIGNDFLHFDSVRNTTTFGDHFLDTDTRYGKVYLAGLQVLSYMIERALELCGRIDLMYVPGNHDTTSSFTLCACLAQRYLNDPRVTMDMEINPRKYRQHGGTILGFAHGKDAKPDRLAQIFAQEMKAQWSESTYQEVQVGHTHQRREKRYESLVPTNSVLVRTNPSLSSVDAWHYNNGFIGEPMKSVEAWRYDKIGYRGSHVAWARDDEHDAVNAVKVI